MSIAKKVGKGFGIMLFTLFLSLAMLSYSMAQFTSYTVIEPAFVSMVRENMPLNKTDLESQHNMLLEYCKFPNTTEMPIQENVSIKCSDISATTPDKLPDLMAQAFFDSIYYKQFDCDFITCLRTMSPSQRSSIILTDMGNQFYSKVWIYLLMAAIAGVALIIACVDTWKSRLKSIGFCLFIAGTPYFMFNFIKKLLPADVASQASPLIDVIVKTLSPKFLIVLVAGIILIVLGFVIQFYEKKSKE